MTTPAAKNPTGNVTVHVFAKTDVGRTREHNEDTFLVADLTEMNASLHPEVRTHVPGKYGSLFMVADGMGGAAAGEIASAMATEVVLREVENRWRKSSESDPETFARALKAAAEAANSRIHRYASDHPENRGMGTTATIAGFLGDSLYLVQVGDSRGYLVRDGVARQLTKDQSLMQKLVEAGELTEEEAEVSERRNIILQALGPEAQVKVDLTHQQIRQGDTLVLCSDGLSGQMRADDIGRIITGTKDLAIACKRMIDLANENGGPDNITVVAVRFEGEGLSVASSGEGVGHQVYSGEAEMRPTVPLDAQALAAIKATAGGGAPPIASKAAGAAVAAGAPGAAGAKGGRLTPDTPYQSPKMDSLGTAGAEAPMVGGAARPVTRSRISEGTLRIIFGVIGAVVAGVILWRLLAPK